MKKYKKLVAVLMIAPCVRIVVIGFKKNYSEL